MGRRGEEGKMSIRIADRLCESQNGHAGGRCETREEGSRDW